MWNTIEKASLQLSNVPGPKTKLDLQGCKCKGFIALVPGIGDLAFGITALSMDDTLYMAI